MSYTEYNTLDKPQLIEEIIKLKECLQLNNEIINRTKIILSNKNQTPLDKNMSISILLEHTQEVLTSTTFTINVGGLCEATAASGKSASTYFQAMSMAQGLEYEDQPLTNKEGKPITLKTVTFSEFFDVADTKNTDIKNKLREEEQSRKKAKIEKVDLLVCPCCHSSDNIMMTNAAICVKCGKDGVIPATEMYPQKEMYRHIEPTEEEIQVQEEENVSAKRKECKQCEQEYLASDLINDLCVYCTANMEKFAKRSKAA